MGTLGTGGSLPSLQQQHGVQGGADPCGHCCHCCPQHGRVPGPNTLQGLPLGDPECRILAPGLSLSEIKSSPPGCVLPSGKTPKIMQLGEKNTTLQVTPEKKAIIIFRILLEDKNEHTPGAVMALVSAPPGSTSCRSPTGRTCRPSTLTLASPPCREANFFTQNLLFPGRSVSLLLQGPFPRSAPTQLQEGQTNFKAQKQLSRI